MRNIAIIPARGGSKRVHRKNIREFHGKPMIAWAIETCIASGCFERIIVSTDDLEITSIALKYGAECPFIRPSSLAGDHTNTIDVILHSIEHLINSGENPDYICCVYPTAPFLSIEDLKLGLNALETNQWNFAFSVTDFSSSVYRSFLQTAEGGLEMLYPQYRFTRTQDLPNVYHDAAQFYWGKTEAWTARIDVFGSTSAPIFIPQWRVQDIDTESDFRRAELMFKVIQNYSSDEGL